MPLPGFLDYGLARFPQSSESVHISRLKHRCAAPSCVLRCWCFLLYTTLSSSAPTLRPLRSLFLSVASRPRYITVTVLRSTSFSLSLCFNILTPCRSPFGLFPVLPTLRQQKSVVTTAVIMTSPITTTTKTYRAASEFSTNLRAAVSFGAFRLSAPPPPPETAGYVSDSPRAGNHSTPVVAIARARPRDFVLVRLTRRAGP